MEHELDPFDVFDLSNSLGEITLNYEYRLCYTFNYPRDKKFRGLDKEHQRELYKIIIEHVKFTLKKQSFEVNDNSFYFEEAGGYLHVHGYMDLEHKENGSCLGTLNAISRQLEYDKIIPVAKNRVNTYEKCDVGIYETHTSLYCPAYCLKMNILKSSVWEDYCAKNAH